MQKIFLQNLLKMSNPESYTTRNSVTTWITISSQLQNFYNQIINAAISCLFIFKNWKQITICNPRAKNTIALKKKQSFKRWPWISIPSIAWLQNSFWPTTTKMPFKKNLKNNDKISTQEVEIDAILISLSKKSWKFNRFCLEIVFILKVMDFVHKLEQHQQVCMHTGRYDEVNLFFLKILQTFHRFVDDFDCVLRFYWVCVLLGAILNFTILTSGWACPHSSWATSSPRG